MDSAAAAENKLQQKDFSGGDMSEREAESPKQSEGCGEPVVTNLNRGKPQANERQPKQFSHTVWHNRKSNGRSVVVLWLRLASEPNYEPDNVQIFWDFYFGSELLHKRRKQRGTLNRIQSVALMDATRMFWICLKAQESDWKAVWHLLCCLLPLLRRSLRSSTTMIIFIMSEATSSSDSSCPNSLILSLLVPSNTWFPVLFCRIHRNPLRLLSSAFSMLWTHLFKSFYQKRSHPTLLWISHCMLFLWLLCCEWEMVGERQRGNDRDPQVKPPCLFFLTLSFSLDDTPALFPFLSLPFTKDHYVQRCSYNTSCSPNSLQWKVH